MGEGALTSAFLCDITAAFRHTAMALNGETKAIESQMYGHLSLLPQSCTRFVFPFLFIYFYFSARVLCHICQTEHTMTCANHNVSSIQDSKQFQALHCYPGLGEH